MGKNLFLLLTVILLFAGCQSNNKKTLSGLNPKNFDTIINGDSVSLYTLKNNSSMEICVTNYGARIVSVMVPDKDGKIEDVVLGYDNIKDYVGTDNNFGATIGRYANRINKGQITIDSVKLQLPCNNFGHCLHGGIMGWDKKVFNVDSVDNSSIVMSIVSPDGDENFPGTVKAYVKFTLKDDNSIVICYNATTDKTTIINMSNHSYFNLSKDPSNTVLDHILYVNSSNFTPIDSTFMTTGEIRSVLNTPMDFTTPKTIGKDIDNDDEQLKNGLGYDHNWVLDTHGDISKVAARVVCPSTGITLEVFTDEPGLQIYTGNFLDGTLKGKNGITYQKCSAIVLESQHYPDSPNKPNWPSVLLHPGEIYNSQCIYKFSVTK